MPPIKIRLRFAKRGDLRLVSHHDLLRCLERALRRAALPVARTQGFNPRPKVAFAQALALGVEGRREVIEIELTEPIAPDEVLRRLSAVLPPGFDLLEAAIAPPGRAARVVAADYSLPVPVPFRAATRDAIETFRSADRWPATLVRGDRRAESDLRPLVLDASLDADGLFHFRIAIDPAGTVRPAEWIQAIGLGDLLATGGILARDDLLLADEAREPAGEAPSPTGIRASVEADAAFLQPILHPAGEVEPTRPDA